MGKSRVDDQKVIELRKQGLTLKEIAKTMGISKATVTNAINRHPEAGIPSKVTKVDDQKVIELRKQGSTIKEITETLNISTGTVHNVINRHPEVEITRQKYNQVDDQKVLELRKQGLTLKEIAETIGISKATVTNVINRHPEAGIPKRITYRYFQVDDQMVLELRKQGLTIKEIAETMEISCVTVTNIIAKHPEAGIPTRKKPIKVDDQMVLELRKQGLTIKEITETMEISRSTVNRILSRHPEISFNKNHATVETVGGETPETPETVKTPETPETSKSSKPLDFAIPGLTVNETNELLNKISSEICDRVIDRLRITELHSPEKEFRKHAGHKIDSQMIIDLNNHGYTNKEIADFMGISITTVYNVTKKNPDKCIFIDRRGAKRRVNDQMIIDLKNQGYANREIADFMGISIGTVHNVLRRHPGEYAENTGNKEFASQLGTSTQEVSIVLKDRPDEYHPMSSHGKRLKKLEPKVLELRRQGLSKNAIAANIGINIASVNKILKWCSCDNTTN